MATNYVGPGDDLRLTVASTVKSGDPVVVGNALRGVALTDYSAVDGKAQIDVGGGIYDLSVQAVDDDGASAVAVGDRLYFGGSATPWLSKKKSGKFFGVALEIIASGTDTINVLVGEIGGPDRASDAIFAAGKYTVVASPSPSTTTTITVTGILAADKVFVQQEIDQAVSPSNQILSAIAQTSPPAIIVTTAGAPTAGDIFNWMVLRATL